MDEVLQFLNENQVVYLSTVGLDGKPKVRPFQFMLERAGKLYFCTNNQKAVYKELQKAPFVEACISTPKMAWIRLSGKAVFSKDPGIKKDILEGHAFLKQIYKSADNPVFEVFYLENAEATIADFSGNPPKKFTL
ncbi:MAG: pyridoxamine 5'-phosphate oxidase family protein [Candidatus Micrarchaeia archaeon]